MISALIQASPVDVAPLLISKPVVPSGLASLVAALIESSPDSPGPTERITLASLKASERSSTLTDDVPIVKMKQSKKANRKPVPSSQPLRRSARLQAKNPH